MTPDGRTDRTAESSDALLYAEQLRLLYGGLPAALAANVLLAILLAAVQWPALSPVLAGGWLALMAAVLTWRGLVGLRYRRDKEQARSEAETAQRWLRRFRLGAIATGAVWGVAGLLLFPPGQIVHQAYVAFVLAGVSAGAITSLSADRTAALGFVVPALVPLMLSFAREGGAIPLTMGLMVVLFLIFVAASAGRSRHQLHENLRLRTEAVAREAVLRRQQQLTEAIARAQSQFIRETARREAFDGLLTDVLSLTESAYGFIGEVLRTPQGDPYLKTYAITDIAWDDATRAFYDEHAPQGMEFHNLETLFGAAMTGGEPVIANDPASDPRRGGLPQGHPALNAFLGIPVWHGGELVAMLGIANRPGGYDRATIEFLQPLLATLGQLVTAMRVQAQHYTSERRLRSIIDGTRIGTWEWNVQTGETVFNERWAEIVGYTLAELEPVNIRTWRDLAHPDDLRESTAMLEKHFAGETDYYDMQCRMRHKDGHWVWVHDRGRVVSWTEDGKPLLMSGTHADITEQKQAEQELNQFKSTLDRTLDCVFMFDAETLRFFYANEGALRQVGYTREELLAMHPYDIKPDITPDQFVALIAPLLAGHKASLTLETVHRHKNGQQIPVEIFLQYIAPADEPARFVAIVRDITERKRVERMKGEFVSTVSHELRTPLTAISGALGLLCGGALGKLAPQAQEMIDIAYRNSQRLNHLINDLLDIEKLAVGKVHFDMRPQPLMPLVEQALEANRAYGAARRVSLTLTARLPDAEVRVDSQRLMQVLCNLLSNAIKYSPEDGTVEVSVERRGGAARVTVADRGPGVPAQFRPRMFQKFSQADSSDTRQKGGTGLGLAISKELVERMGGRIGFDSAEGDGARFFFELPL